MYGSYWNIHPQGPATSLFEIVELPVSKPSLLNIPKGTKGHKGTNAYKHEWQRYPTLIKHQPQ
jgi:hypothetical protein